MMENLLQILAENAPIFMLLSALFGAVIAYFAFKNYQRNISLDNEQAHELETHKKRVSIYKTESEYINKQVKAIESAQISIQVWLHTIHTSTNYSARAQPINGALKVAHNRGVMVRVLSSDNRDQIKGAYELAEEIGLRVMFSPELTFSDLRFTKVDSNKLIVGLSNLEKGESDFTPSKNWLEVNSHGISQLIDKEFERIWLHSRTRTFHQYFAKYLEEFKHIPLRDIANTTNLPQNYITEFKSRIDISFFKTTTLIFHGKSAAGKSDLLNLVSKTWAIDFIDMDDVILPIIHKYGNEEVKDDKIKEMYSLLIDHCYKNQYDIIETGTELVEDVLPSIIQSVQNHKKTPILVYFKIDPSSAIKRNSERVRPVPNQVIENQHKSEESKKYEQICRDKEIDLIEIDSTKPTTETFKDLVTQLGIK